jgi:hypothetical protein
LLSFLPTNFAIVHKPLAGKFAISFAIKQLKDHEKYYSLFLLEAAAAVWGMVVFNEYLRGLCLNNRH